MKCYAADVVSGQHWLHWLLGARRDFAILRPRPSPTMRTPTTRYKGFANSPRSCGARRPAEDEEKSTKVSCGEKTPPPGNCPPLKLFKRKDKPMFSKRLAMFDFYSTYPTPPLPHLDHTGDQQKHKSFINNGTCFSVPRIRPNGQPHAVFESTMQE